MIDNTPICTEHDAEQQWPSKHCARPKKMLNRYSTNYDGGKAGRSGKFLRAD